MPYTSIPDLKIGREVYEVYTECRVTGICQTEPTGPCVTLLIAWSTSRVQQLRRAGKARNLPGCLGPV